MEVGELETGSELFGSSGLTATRRPQEKRVAGLVLLQHLAGDPNEQFKLGGDDERLATGGDLKVGSH